MNTQYTNTLLKQALAKMLLPNNIGWGNKLSRQVELENGATPTIAELTNQIVLDTELLHLCWLVEETIQGCELGLYMQEIDLDGDWAICHATWQQRTIALCKVKGIEI